MSHPRFSSNLFEQLGGVNWAAREAFSAQSAPAASPEEVEPLVQKVDEAVNKTAPLNAVIVIGPGLSPLWQDESRPEWRLWSNICEAFGWDEEQAHAYDTQLLSDEKALFATVEEIIASGAEWVLSMDSEETGEEAGPLAEALADGLQVLTVPSLESMLADPYAKHAFFQTVAPFLKQV